MWKSEVHLSLLNRNVQYRAIYDPQFDGEIVNDLLTQIHVQIENGEIKKDDEVVTQLVPLLQVIIEIQVQCKEFLNNNTVSDKEKTDILLLMIFLQQKITNMLSSQ